MGKKVIIRDGIDDDALLVMTWRSNPLVYAGFLKQKAPLQFENHWDYWKSLKNYKHWIILYGEGEYQRPVGQVNAQKLDTDCPEVGYFIGETPLWGKGIATEAVRLVLDELWEMGYDQVCADTKPDNIASQVLLRRLGFEQTVGRDGLIGWIRKL